MGEESPTQPTAEPSVTNSDDAVPPADGSVDALVSLVEHGAGIDLRDTITSERNPTTTDTERATLVTREAGDLVDAIAAQLADAGSLVAVLPRIDSAVVQAVGSDVRPGGPSVDVRIVFVGPARTRISGPGGTAIRAALTAQSIEWYVSDVTAHVGLLLADEHAVVGGFDNGRLETALLTTDEAICSWVAESCRRYLETANSSE